MKKKILFIASNYGLWAEELQAPWDILNDAGHECTLATYRGTTPLPFKASLDASFLDPIQNYNVNPKSVVDRVNEILRTGEWDNPLNFAKVNMDDYDVLVIVGGPGSPFDITGNMNVHNLVLKAYKSKKIIGAICYAVAALSFTRDPDNNMKSIIHGKTVTAHPHAWDFTADMSYDLVNTVPGNIGTNIVTAGFVYPLQFMIQDAVGDNGKVLSDDEANREKPCTSVDLPFVTGLSVESSIQFGEKLREVLS